MTHAKRGRGTRHGAHLCTVVALGLALSACGGGAGSAAGAAAAQGSQPQQGSVASDGSAAAQTSAAAQSATDPQGTSSGGSPPTASAGAVTINWMPPTENVDGSALTNLAGYHIHYGTASGKYTQTISVSNAGLATYVVSDLTPGRYYFAVAAVNSSGTESPLSPEVSATVN